MQTAASSGLHFVPFYDPARCFRWAINELGKAHCQTDMTSRILREGIGLAHTAMASDDSPDGGEYRRKV